MEFFDAHFHVWDITEGTGVHDGAILFAPDGLPLYDCAAYEGAVAPCAAVGFEHSGGVFVEAMSVCYPGTSASEHNARCVEEAKWALAMLETSSKHYVYIPSACLEDEGVAATLDTLRALSDKVHGIRQIVNSGPNWPRNGATGNLLLNEQWKKGYADLARVGFSFDLQLNPTQFAAAAALIAANPAVKVAINHLGTPTAACLSDPATAAVYWEGMTALAAAPHTAIKLSMLCYVDAAWDSNDVVKDAVHRIIELFGIERCMMASNLPPDGNDGWGVARLFPAAKALLQRYGDDGLAKLFALNARAFYGA